MSKKNFPGAALLLAMALIPVLTAAPAALASGGHDVLFLGITDKRGESAHAQLETAIRHYLASNQRFRLLGEVETQRVIREIERTGRNRTEPFIPASAVLPDTMMIIRGVVEELTFTPARRLLAMGRINARITLMMYFNRTNEAVAYQGEFTATARKNKGVLLFANPQKTIHISATDRSELTRTMHDEVVRKVSEFSRTFFNSLETGPLHQKAAAEAEAGAGADSAAAKERTADAEKAGGDDFPGAEELMTE